MKLYIASSEKYVGNIKEDIYIRDMFVSKGVPTKIATLKDILVVAEPLDVVMIKSIWGYHLDFRTFLSQLDILEQRNIRLINKYDFVRWNINKNLYLKDVAQFIPIVPMTLLKIEEDDGAAEVKGKILDAAYLFKTEMLVIKPVISASGFLTYKYDVNMNNEDVITLIMKNSNLEFIIQPYYPSVSDGELSVVAIRGDIHYGVIRRPGLFALKGEVEYVDTKDISFQVIEVFNELKEFFFNKFSTLPDICRIDFLKKNDKYEVLEIELIDPDLYLKNIDINMQEKVLSTFSKIL